MNLLDLFMFMVFAIGVLLLAITFKAYGEFDEKCTYQDLRTKLRYTIIIGTVFITIPIGYTVCTRAKSCKCNFGAISGVKLYLMLGALLSMGSGLLVLTMGIKKELEKSSCNVDLGVTPNILMGVSIAQIALPVMYALYTLVNKCKKTVKEDDDIKSRFDFGSRGGESSVGSHDSSRVPFDWL